MGKLETSGIRPIVIKEITEFAKRSHIVWFKGKGRL